MSRRFVACLVGLSAVLAFVALGLPMANAQSGQVRFVVPFAFTVGASEMSAGTYFVTRDDAASTSFITVRNSKQTIGVSSNPLSTSSTGPARLVFKRYRQHYFLREVWFQSNGGRALPETGKEHILAEDSRAALEPPAIVTIVASPR